MFQGVLDYSACILSSHSANSQQRSHLFQVTFTMPVLELFYVGRQYYWLVNVLKEYKTTEQEGLLQFLCQGNTV